MSNNVTREAIFELQVTTSAEKTRGEYRGQPDEIKNEQFVSIRLNGSDRDEDWIAKEYGEDVIAFLMDMADGAPDGEWE